MLELVHAAFRFTYEWGHKSFQEHFQCASFHLFCPDGVLVFCPGVGGCPGDPLVVYAFHEAFCHIVRNMQYT